MIDLGKYNKFLQGVYVDLDSIFDTRFAVLEQVDPLLALKNLKNGWNTRTNDVFEGIDKKLFDELYQTRDNSVLAIAPRTMMMDAVKTWVLKALATIQGSPNGDSVEVFINVWPYTIDRAHARSIGDSIMEILGNQVTIHMINVPLDKLCTRTMRRYFSAVFMYDYDIWLEGATKAGYFEQMRMPDVSLYGPKLYKNNPPSQEQEREMLNAKMDVFAHFEVTAGPQVALEFIDPAFFSCMLPEDYLDHYDTVKAATQNL